MKLFLIDGHALVFKMYYAFLGRPMVNSKGVDTSILFGFTKYLLELIEKERPTHLAVSFDPPGGTFRNTMYPAYKANRSETPQLVIDALEPLTAIVKSLDIPVLMVHGFEADDVIGSMARRCAAPGMDVYMVTPDKDYGQLVSGHIFQYKPGKGGAEGEVMGEAEVCEKWGIQNTAQVIDILTICGDASDNVPGVQGVGPVGASKLLGKYASVDGIYEHLSELTPRQRELFEAARDHIALSRELVTIKTDIALETTLEDMVLDLKWTPAVEEIFKLYEFPSLIRLVRRLSDSLGTAGPAAPAAPSAKAPEVVRTEPSKITDSRVAVHLVGETVYAADSHGVASGSPQEFRALLSDPSRTKVGIGLKQQIEDFALAGTELAGPLEDLEIMHYLLGPERSHKLDVLASAYLGIELGTASGEEQGSLFGASEDSGPDHFLEASVLLPLADALKAEMERTDPRLQELYSRIEEPLIRELARMEMDGVKIDLDALRAYADGLRVQAAEKEALVRDLSGEPSLNINSPKQIGEVIFEKLKLDPKAKKPRKGNWPTDEKTLQELSDRSPIIEAILSYRGLRKLLGTYIEPFPSYVSPRDGRVHTTFNQALTATGRLSSSNPNLQNIPIRTPEGREIRKAFVPGEEGWVVMSADYSQIELRIMAHLSGDGHLLEAFREGIDVHAATAAKIFRVPISEVSADQRRIAKTANFGIMYGISAFGLSQNLGCSRSEAARLIDDYFASFPSIRGWIDSTLASARERGYVETLLGRRRYVPDITSGNATVRSFAERNAVNAPIQGTSADIIKMAMVAVDRRLEGLRSRMVLQIHDELLLEVPSEEIETVSAMLKEEMQGVISLNVPLTVECNYGSNWLEAH